MEIPRADCMLDKQCAILEDTTSKKNYVNKQKKNMKKNYKVAGETRHEVWEHIFSNDCTLNSRIITKVKNIRYSWTQFTGCEFDW